MLLSQLVIILIVVLVRRRLSLHPGKLQAVVESIVEKITLDKDEIQIDLFYLPTSHQSDREPDPGKGNGTSGIGNGSPSGSGDHGNGSAPLPISSISTVADTFSENMTKGVPALQCWEMTVSFIRVPDGTRGDAAFKDSLRRR